MTVVMVCVWGHKHNSSNGVCGGHKHDFSNGVCGGVTSMTLVMVCVGGSQA